MLKQLNEESFKILSFKNLTVNQIKSLGLSKNKAKSIKSLVLFFSQNPNSKNLYKLSKEERYDNLIKIFGIGKWSIEMFEMFCVRKQKLFFLAEMLLLGSQWKNLEWSKKLVILKNMINMQKSGTLIKLLRAYIFGILLNLRLKQAHP